MIPLGEVSCVVVAVVVEGNVVDVGVVVVVVVVVDFFVVVVVVVVVDLREGEGGMTGGKNGTSSVINVNYKYQQVKQSSF